MSHLTRRTLIASTTGVGLGCVLAGCSDENSEVSPLRPLDLSEPEIANSGRGQLFWLGQPADPSSWPLVDIYERPDGGWKSVETSPGRYDWTILDRALERAAKRGGRLLWRIMPWYMPNRPAEAPPWVPTRTVHPKDAKAFSCPDWDNPRYLEAWINLMRSLAAHADRNPRLWAVDISGFGAWGEHYWEDSWGHGMTPASFLRIAEAMRDAFPNTWVLGPAMEPGFSIMPNAFEQGGRWGTRYDFLGGQELSYEDVPGYRDLWHTGPVVTEWGSSKTVSMSMGLENVRRLHVSLLSSGNKPRRVDQLPPQEQQAFLTANKIAGFRYSLDAAKYPLSWGRGEQFRLATTWTNHGVAPTYDRWQLELLMGSKVVALAGDLRKVLPGTHTFEHTVVAPTPTAPLALRAVDPAGVLPPMMLASRPRLDNGAYPLSRTR